MAHRENPATHPYAAVWIGVIPEIATKKGVMSAHRRPDLAVRACRAMRDRLRPLWGSHKPWFHYQVIDVRSGDVVAYIK